MLSYILLPYGFRKKTEPIQPNLPKNHVESQYLNLPNKDPIRDNQILNAVKNRKDLQKWLLATSDIGQEIQEDVNAIVGGGAMKNLITLLLEEHLI